MRLVFGVGLVWLALFLVPIAVYGLFSAVTGLAPPGNSPMLFLAGTAVSKLGTALAFVLVYHLARDALAPQLVAYVALWWLMFVVGEVGQAITPEYSWQEAIAGIAVVKTYAMEPVMRERFAGINEELYRRHLGLVRVNGAMPAITSLLPALGLLLVFAVGGAKGIPRDQFFTFAMLIYQLTFPTFIMGWVVALVQRGAAAMQRIDEVLATEPSIADRPDRAVAHRLAAAAEEHAGHALAAIGTAGSAQRETVVDDSVAVVVERVAQLGDRADRAGALELSGHTGRGARAALTGVVAARCAAAGIALVDAGVAVVVEPVAELGHGAALADAHQRAAHALGLR